MNKSDEIVFGGGRMLWAGPIKTVYVMIPAELPDWQNPSSPSPCICELCRIHSTPSQIQSAAAMEQ